MVGDINKQAEFSLPTSKGEAWKKRRAANQRAFLLSALFGQYSAPPLTPLSPKERGRGGESRGVGDARAGPGPDGNARIDITIEILLRITTVI